MKNTFKEWFVENINHIRWKLCFLPPASMDEHLMETAWNASEKRMLVFASWYANEEYGRGFADTSIGILKFNSITDAFEYWKENVEV